MRYLILISIIFLVGCNPCKYVSKHPECFPADTVKIINDVIRYEKEYITNDSIIRDTIPCDPIEKTYYKTKTVYKTKYSIKIDTIYQYKDVAKINPINVTIEKENKKLNSKIDRKNTLIKILSAFSIIMLLISLFLYKFK